MSRNTMNSFLCSLYDHYAQAVYLIPHVFSYGSSVGNWCDLYGSCLSVCLTLSSHQETKVKEGVPQHMGSFTSLQAQFWVHLRIGISVDKQTNKQRQTLA